MKSKTQPASPSPSPNKGWRASMWIAAAVALAAAAFLVVPTPPIARNLNALAPTGAGVSHRPNGPGGETGQSVRGAIPLIDHSVVDPQDPAVESDTTGMSVAAYGS